MLVWQLGNGDEGTLGFPKRALRGHSHYVQVLAVAGWLAVGRAGAGGGPWCGSGGDNGQPQALPRSSTATFRTFSKPPLPCFPPRTHALKQDVVISSDGQFCLTGSWDGTLRLWDITTGATTRRFLGHTKDVLSVAFSADNRQVRSGWVTAYSLQIAPQSFHSLRSSPANQPPCACTHSPPCMHPPTLVPAPVPTRLPTPADCVWLS